MSKLLELQMQKLMNLVDDDELAAQMQAKSAHQVMSEFLLALSQLLVHHRVMHDISHLAVNFSGHARRVDIAALTEDGQHLEQWLLGLNANLADEQLGTPVSLPMMSGPVQ